MTRPPRRQQVSAAPTTGPAWLRALAVFVALLAIGAVFHAARVGYAAWLVFPAPDLQPELELAVGSAANPLARLERVTGLVPGDSRYWHLRAEVERRRALERWFQPEGGVLLERSVEHARRAVDLVPTNPYHRELLAGVLLDRARRETDSPEMVREAVEQLREALALAPGSPVVAQQAGMDLLRAWSLLDEEARELATASLLQAATWNGAYLRASHQTVVAHLSLEEAVVVAGSVTPPTTDGANRLEGFLRNVSDRIPAGSARRERIAPVVIDAGADLLRRSGYPASEMLDWALWGARAFPGQRLRMVEIVRAVQEQMPQEPGPPLALAALVEDPDTRVQLAEEAVRLAESASAEVHRMALERLGAMLEEEGRPDAALEVYRSMAALAPEKAEPLLDAARVLQTLGRRADALEALETAASRDPLSLDARRALGDGYYQRAQFQRAIDTWRYVVQRAPRDAATRLQLARAYEQLGRIDDAERYYESAAEVDEGLRRELERFRARISGIEQ